MFRPRSSCRSPSAFSWFWIAFARVVRVSWCSSSSLLRASRSSAFTRRTPMDLCWARLDEAQVGGSIPCAALLTGLVLPERRGGATLVHREIADLEFSGPLVAVNDDARSRRRRIRKPESPRDGTVVEQPFPRANQDRKDPQAKLVDQVVLQQRLDQVGAPLDQDFASGLLLEPGNGGRCIPP